MFLMFSWLSCFLYVFTKLPSEKQPTQLKPTNSRGVCSVAPTPQLMNGSMNVSCHWAALCLHRITETPHGPYPICTLYVWGCVCVCECVRERKSSFWNSRGHHLSTYSGTGLKKSIIRSIFSSGQPSMFGYHDDTCYRVHAKQCIDNRLVKLPEKDRCMYPQSSTLL